MFSDRHAAVIPGKWNMTDGGAVGAAAQNAGACAYAPGTTPSHRAGVNTVNRDTRRKSSEGRGAWTDSEEMLERGGPA